MARFDRLHEIERLDPEHDCQRIMHLSFGYEFCWDSTRALELALYRTYCVPSISALLDRTGEFYRATQRRYDDTAILIAELCEWGYEEGRGHDALSRINWAHGHFKIDNDEFDKVMTINARSIHQATKAALPAMLRAGGGKICNIASGTFYYGPPGLSHYTASKAAVIGLTRGHARELGDKNIQINAIAVGLTESSSIKDDDKWDRARAPTVDSRSIKREMVPEDLLGTLMFLVTSDSDFITGQTINVDGGKVNL